MVQVNSMLNFCAIVAVMFTAGIWMASPGRPQPLPNDAKFVVQVQHPGTVLVKFGAEWCPPCRQIEAELDAIARSDSPTVAVVKIDIGQQPALAQHYQATRIPCLILFKDGHQVARTTGYHSRDQLQAWIASTQ